MTSFRSALAALMAMMLASSALAATAAPALIPPVPAGSAQIKGALVCRDYVLASGTLTYAQAAAIINQTLVTPLAKKLGLAPTAPFFSLSMAPPAYNGATFFNSYGCCPTCW